MSTPARSAALRAAGAVAKAANGCGPPEVRCVPGRRADMESAPTAERESYQQPPEQRVTRGKRSRGKCNLVPRPSAAPSMRLRGFSTAGVRRRVGGAADFCRTDSLDPRICQTLRVLRKVWHPAVFSSTGRGAFSFVKTKENGGRIPRESPDVLPVRRGKEPPYQRPPGRERADIESAPTGAAMGRQSRGFGWWHTSSSRDNP